MANSGDDGTVDGQELEPWFSRRESVYALLYKVNRRPRTPQTLFAVEPDDIFKHITEVLLFGHAVQTGTRYQRTWVLGNRQVDVDRRTLSGQIGFTSAGEHDADWYDEESQEWVSGIELLSNTARAPFLFHAESRILAILHAPRFNERVLPSVFRTLLNRGENERETPSTDWDVEPLLDRTNFLQWLREADSVQKVVFVAKLPNPSGREAFDPVWSRLEARRAKVLREEMEARDPDEGLQGLEEDREARSFIALAQDGFGYVKGKRRRNGRTQQYDQRNKVQRRRLLSPPGTWTEAAERLRVLVGGTPTGRGDDGGS